MKVSELHYPDCSQALAAEARAVALDQSGRAMLTEFFQDSNSSVRRHRFSSESAQGLAAVSGRRAECTLLCRTVAPNEDHEIIWHGGIMIALCQYPLKGHLWACCFRGICGQVVSPRAEEGMRQPDSPDRRDAHCYNPL